MILCIFIGSSDGTLHFSEANRIISTFIEKNKDSSILLYLHSYIQLYYQKYNKVIESRTKLIENETKSKDNYELFKRSFKTISHYLHHIKYIDIMKILFEAYFNVHNYE